LLPVVLREPFQPKFVEIDGSRKKVARVKMTDMELGKRRNQLFVRVFKDILT
jgi:hypothetical protein